MINYKKYLDVEIFEGEISKHQYPWHFHTCYTIIFIERGSIIYEFQNEILLLDEAEVLIIEPAMVHRNIISQTTTYKAFFIPQEYFQRDGKNNLVTQKVTNSNVLELLADFLNKIEQNYSKPELKEAIFEICESIDKLQADYIDDAPASLNTIPKLNHDLTIEELADEANLSKFHFQRKFKKKCGLTIGQLKQQEKTTEAKALLENGKLSTEVAYELGFFDQSHFIKYFKKMWAITPKNFK